MFLKLFSDIDYVVDEVYLLDIKDDPSVRYVDSIEDYGNLSPSEQNQVHIIDGLTLCRYVGESRIDGGNIFYLMNLQKSRDHKLEQILS